MLQGWALNEIHRAIKFMCFKIYNTSHHKAAPISIFNASYTNRYYVTNEKRTYTDTHQCVQYYIDKSSFAEILQHGNLNFIFYLFFPLVEEKRDSFLRVDSAHLSYGVNLAGVMAMCLKIISG